MGGPITIYSGQHQQTTESLISAFEKKTGIQVVVRYNDEDTLAAEIVTEAPHPVADVFVAENSPPLEYLQSKGLLAPVSAATLHQTPGRYNSPAGDWVGVSARVSVLTYNPGLITRDQLPTSVMQLASPRYQGKLALAPGETDFQPIVASVERTYGRARAVAWLKGLGSNASGHTYLDDEAIANGVNRGAVALGVINQYYWYRMGALLGRGSLHSRIAYFAPGDPGYVVDVSGAAVLRSSKHRAAAEEFLAFLVSKPGQALIAHSTSFEYPLDDGVQAPAVERPFSQLRPNPVTIAQLGDGANAVSLLKAAGLL